MELKNFYTKFRLKGGPGVDFIACWGNNWYEKEALKSVAASWVTYINWLQK